LANEESAKRIVAMLIGWSCSCQSGGQRGSPPAEGGDRRGEEQLPGSRVRGAPGVRRSGPSRLREYSMSIDRNQSRRRANEYARPIGAQQAFAAKPKSLFRSTEEGRQRTGPASEKGPASARRTRPARPHPTRSTCQNGLAFVEIPLPLC